MNTKKIIPNKKEGLFNETGGVSLWTLYHIFLYLSSFFSIKEKNLIVLKQ